VAKALEAKWLTGFEKPPEDDGLPTAADQHGVGEMMNPGEVGVLFVDDSPVPSASAARALSSLQCEWRYAASCEEALAAMEERKFRVVLSKFRLADGSGRRLIPAAQMASAWLFLSFPVEDGCWWIPVIEAGRLSVEGAALHSREFRNALVKIVKAAVAGAPQESSTQRANALENLNLYMAKAAG
jgi:DNA-binding NarL/FixJ family response regulator